jgi:hypothetical protein
MSKDSLDILAQPIPLWRLLPPLCLGGLRNVLLSSKGASCGTSSRILRSWAQSSKATMSLLNLIDSMLTIIWKSHACHPLNHLHQVRSIG